MLAANLQDHGTNITLTWIPGHCRIRGNDLADEAARTATTRPDLDINLPPSTAQIKTTIKKNITRLHKAEHADEVANGSPSATWYAEATRGEPLHLPSHTHPKVRADIHRIRLGYPTLRELGEDPPVVFCAHCETPTHKPLLHYILGCPNTRRLRSTNRQYPDAEDPQAREAAAGVIASTPTTLLAEVVTTAPPP